MMSHITNGIGIHPLQCNEDLLDILDPERLDLDRWESDGGRSLLTNL